MEEPFVVGPGLVFHVVGWADVHHPCAGHIRTQVRVCLPEEYLQWETMRDLVAQLFAEVGVPADETYEAHFVAASKRSSIEQATDRDGMTDRLY
jgi:hypothetical protein